MAVRISAPMVQEIIVNTNHRYKTTYKYNNLCEEYNPQTKDYQPADDEIFCILGKIRYLCNPK